MPTQLESWNAGAARSAIIDFVTQVTAPNSPTFVPPAARIATFDNIGRRPIMAAGNSDGDIHMLKYAVGHKRATLGLLVHHDDAEREYAYDGGSEKALRLAAQEGWIVVSMKDDWRTVF